MQNGNITFILFFLFFSIIFVYLLPSIYCLLRWHCSAWRYLGVELHDMRFTEVEVYGNSVQTLKQRAGRRIRQGKWEEKIQIEEKHQRLNQEKAFKGEGVKKKKEQDSKMEKRLIATNDFKECSWQATRQFGAKLEHEDFFSVLTLKKKKNQ